MNQEKKFPDWAKIQETFRIPQASHPERLYALKHISDSDKVIYDLGCSTFKAMDRAIGVDIEAKTGVDLVASIDDMPMIKSGSVDVIITKHSLEHVPDTIKTLTEWQRILKYGAKIVIVLPDFEYIDTMNPILSSGVHLHVFTREILRNLLTKFPGLEVEKFETVIPDWSFGGVIKKKPFFRFWLDTLMGI